MTEEFTKPKALWPKPTFWLCKALGDTSILDYRKQKMIHIVTILSIGNGLEGSDFIRAQYEADYESNL